MVDKEEFSRDYDERDQHRYIARYPPIREEPAAPPPPVVPPPPPPPPPPPVLEDANNNNNNGEEDANNDNNNGDSSPALQLTGRLRFNHRGRLMYYVPSRTFSNKDVWLLNLAELQRLNLQVMRKRLAKLAVVDLGLGTDDSLSEKDAKELERQLYAMLFYAIPTAKKTTPRTGQALRDWDYMQQQRDRHEFPTDPFKLSSSWKRDHSIMEGTGLMDNIPTRWEARLPRRQMEPDDSEAPELPGHSRGGDRKGRKLREVTERLMCGIIGGLALIAPMLIMVLHGSVLTALLTVSVATILFVVAGALYLDVGPVQLIGATAAYAAVLVVFVGSTNPSS
ncbi:hypothetical protein LAWI1_G008352 [Lachnellula willkommii]|uniref:DUF6594 domain-containing protein n=1 Tax=Lachnellula willkommii TaxID=215461 RepID=A0A559M936_9HELO|nr:hypothetical protein LAWI1_G008352 [Lachnellula willkommii]